MQCKDSHIPALVDGTRLYSTPTVRHTGTPLDALVVINVGVQQFLLILVQQATVMLQELSDLQHDKDTLAGASMQRQCQQLACRLRALPAGHHK